MTSMAGNIHEKKSENQRNTSNNSNITPENKYKIMLKTCKKLIKRIENERETNLIKLRNELIKNNKYKQLHDDHFAIFHSIVTRKVNKDNVWILKRMLEQKKQVDNNQIELRNATDKISTLLSTHFNVDWSKLEPPKE